MNKESNGMMNGFRRLILLSVLVISSILMFYAFFVSNENSKLFGKSGAFFFVVSPGSNKTLVEPMIGGGICKVPNVKPYDKRVLPYLSTFVRPKCENTQLDAVVSNLDGTIDLNKTVLRQGGIKEDEISCRYHAIHRVNETDDKVIFEPVVKFSSRTLVNTDVAYVDCRSQKNGGKQVVFYQNYLPLYHKKNTEPRRGHEKPNILFIGSDSLSRLNCMRNLPKTYTYLKDRLKAHIFRLHVKCGLNTRPNMMAMLTGKRIFQYSNKGEIIPAELESGPSIFVDHYPLVWKEYAKVGYTTFLGENVPDSTMFNYRRVGFRYQPVDHYMRNFWLAWTNFKNEGVKTKKSKKDCVMNVPMYTTQFNWAVNLMRLYRDSPTFGIIFDGFTHNELSQFKILDEPLVDTLDTLQNEKLLENTILFVIGDHGVRSGKYRKTWLGRLEDNMPFFSIVLPEWIKSKYPHLDEVLKYNEGMISTWYDVHATLVDIVNGDYGDVSNLVHTSNGRGLSMFKKFPSDRTCLDAGVPLEFCPCLEEKALSVTDEAVNTGAQAMVDAINIMLQDKKDMCKVLRLNQVKEATEIEIQTDHESDGEMVPVGVRMVIEASGAVFESVLTYSSVEKKYIAKDVHIQRVDLYGSKGSCVNDKFLERYCICI